MPVAKHVVRRQSVLVARPAAAAPVAWQAPVPGAESSTVRELSIYRSAFLWILVGWCGLLVPIIVSGLPLVPRTLTSGLFLVGAFRLSKVNRRGKVLAAVVASVLVATALFEGVVVWNLFADPSLREPLFAEIFEILYRTVGTGAFLAALWILLSIIRDLLLTHRAVDAARDVVQRRYWIMGTFAGAAMLALAQRWLGLEDALQAVGLVPFLLLAMALLVLTAWIMLFRSLVWACQMCAAQSAKLRRTPTADQGIGASAPV